MALWTEWISAYETGGNNETGTAVVNLNGSYGRRRVVRVV